MQLCVCVHVISFCTWSRGWCLKPEEPPSVQMVQCVDTRRRTYQTCGAAPQTQTAPGGELLGICGGTLASVSSDTNHSIRYTMKLWLRKCGKVCHVSIRGKSALLFLFVFVLNELKWYDIRLRTFVLFASCCSQNGWRMSSEYREVKMPCPTPNGNTGNTHA